MEIVTNQLELNIQPILPYFSRLRERFPNIDSIWLMGSRANNTAREDSDWDLLVFADKPIFDAIAADSTFFDAAIDLMVVFDGDKFENPFGGRDGRRVKNGSLSEWEWRHFSLDIATYKVSAAPRA